MFGKVGTRQFEQKRYFVVSSWKDPPSLKRSLNELAKNVRHL